VRSTTPSGHHQVSLETDGAGAWRVDRAPRPDLDGCLDVDLESSACTNSFPVHRMQRARVTHSEAPAAWVRVRDLGDERLGQHYRRAEHIAGPELRLPSTAVRLRAPPRLSQLTADRRTTPVSRPASSDATSSTRADHAASAGRPRRATTRS
jgi:hypothetical protein